MNFSSIFVFLFAFLVLLASVSYTDGLSIQDKRTATLQRIKAAMNAQKTKLVSENHRKLSGRDIVDQVKQRRHIK